MTSIGFRFVQASFVKGRRYYYFRRPGCARVRLPGLPGSAASWRPISRISREPAARRYGETNTPGTVARW